MKTALCCPICHHRAMGFFRKMETVGGDAQCCLKCSAPLSVRRYTVAATSFAAIVCSQFIGVGALFVLPFSIWPLGPVYFFASVAGYSVPLAIAAAFSTLKAKLETEQSSKS